MHHSLTNLLGFLLAASSLTLPASAYAQTEDLEDLAAWTTDPGFDLARRLWTEHRILPLHELESQWKPEELMALERGAAAVPRIIVDGLPQTVRMRRVHRTCLFGVGRYTKGCPTYDRRGNFLVYDLPPLQGEGPVMRLKPLNADERAEIQYRRAAVHAIFSAFDEEHEWSDDPRWRAINGWRSRRQAMNRDMWGFSRYLGSRTPSLDLVTFAESWLVRPEDVIDPARRDTLDPNMGLECQEFTKARFFAERLALLDPAWHPPARDPRPPPEQCPAFEAWAKLDHIEAIDLLVASATADRPESLYGHLLLHIRYDDRSEGFEPVYQFGAVTDTNVDPLTYFSRGLLGGFLSVVEVNSFRAVDRMFLQYEQRGLRRYELALSPRQRRNLMERLWEYERRYRYPYYFFSNNCASFLIDLIGPALELDVPDRSHLVVAPTDVLDYLADVENGERGALLRKRPEMEFSSREVAQASVRKRREALHAMLDATAAPPKTERLLLRLDRALDDEDPVVREAAYRDIEELLLGMLKTTRGDAVDHAIDYLYHASRIERYFAEVAFFRVREIKMNAVLEPRHYSADELLERRRELYATEDPEERFAKLLEWTEAHEKQIIEGPHRQLTPREQRAMQLAKATEDAYAAALDAQANVIETFRPDFDGVAYLQQKEDAFVAAQKRRDALAVGPSGKGRIALGGAAAVVDGAEFAPHGTVVGSYSFIWERLGEQRRRGFRSDVESRALGFELFVPTTEEFWLNADLDVTLFRFLTIEQKLGAIRRSFFDVFGWGADVRLDHDGRRGLDFAGNVAGGLLVPVWQTDSAANHLVLGLWADARVALTDQGRLSLGGGDAFARLLVHLGGVYANSLRLEVGTRQWLGVENLSHQWEHRARLSTEHASWWVGQYPLVISPWIQGEWTSLDFTGTRTDFRAVRAGLSFELPL